MTERDHRLYMRYLRLCIRGSYHAYSASCGASDTIMDIGKYSLMWIAKHAAAHREMFIQKRLDPGYAIHEPKETQ